MNDLLATWKKQGRALSAPSKGAVLKWGGRVLPMFPQAEGWRVRSRSKAFPVDFFFNTPSLPEAKRLAKEKLSAMPEPQEKARGTLEDASRLYLAAPKRCSQDTAEGNISRLRSVVRDAWGKALDQVQADRLSELWPAYVAAKQGRKQPDYSSRRRENHGIVSAMKQAASVFLPALWPYYRRQGLILPADAVTILWPATSTLVKPEAREDALLDAWQALRNQDLDLWLVIGLARFAGLRQSEILAYRGKWLEMRGTVPHVRIKDREEDGFFNKTGKNYSALILNPDLAEYLSAMQPEQALLCRPDAARWIQRAPQQWLKPFTGDAKAPLHRLRGLYADHVRRETEQAILARQAATKQASQNLGHTSTKTTEDHYLSETP